MMSADLLDHEERIVSENLRVRICRAEPCGEEGCVGNDPDARLVMFAPVDMDLWLISQWSRDADGLLESVPESDFTLTANFALLLGVPWKQASTDAIDVGLRQLDLTPVVPPTYQTAPFEQVKRLREALTDVAPERIVQHVVSMHARSLERQ